MNVSMWLKALQTIPRIEEAEWRGLDIISRFLIASRSGVLVITFISASLAGLFAHRAGRFELGLWLLLTQYAFVVYLVAAGFFSPLVLVVALAYREFLQTFKLYLHPKPAAGLPAGRLAIVFCGLGLCPQPPLWLALPGRTAR